MLKKENAGASLLVAMSAVRKGAASEGMTVKDYVWRGHDPTSVAVLMEVLIVLVHTSRPCIT